MLMAHPAVLRSLIERYEALQAAPAGEQTRQRLADVSYTLCVSTGTRTVEAALAAARRRLAETGAGGPAVAATSAPAGGRT
ncbi:DUF5133 domain-containing protein, partial [Streptomyces sp. B1866]|uniref:DUF5133 domain-containing protein n=1 Tax=Streptomyces sp. B1866 TaxID=3075431 RepID=UPI00288D4635